MTTLSTGLTTPLSAEIRQRAAYLRLDLRPDTRPATALVDALASEVALLGGRVNQRRSAAGQAVFRAAVGAIVGGLLVNWHDAVQARPGSRGARCRPGLSYRPREKGSFTGEPVAFRQYDSALRGLQAAGYVDVEPARHRFHGARGCPRTRVEREAGRLWPTERLLRVAGEAKARAAEARDHFRGDPRSEAKPPVVLRALGERRGATKLRGECLPLPRHPRAEEFASGVQGMNHFAAVQRVEVAGVRTEVAWYRLFTHDFGLHGRWYARGESYQGLPGDERASRITINGEACAEVDVRASHLACLYGLLGVPFDPERDPYDVRVGPPREVVKTWVTASLGRGAALSGQAWPRAVVQRMREENLDLGVHPLPAVSQAVLERHPVLAGLPGRFGFLRRHYGVDPRRVLSLFLMGREASAVTAAMLALRAQDVLALPVHDSLVVPQRAVKATKQALTAAFRERLRVTPGLRVKWGTTPNALGLAA